MSKSSPADLSVTFRSIARRLDEALGDDPPAADTRLSRQLDRAGQLLRTSPDATAIADAIGSVRADEWDPALLDELRDIALDIGHELRRLADEHRPDDT